MPTISEFNGIIITMNFADHPPPHFHAQYGEHEAVVGINPIVVIRGSLPARVQSMVFDWASSRQLELRENWQRASSLRPVAPIDPLD